MIDAKKLLTLLIKAAICGLIINILFGLFLLSSAQDLAARSCRMIAETVFTEGCLPSSQVLEYQTYIDGGYQTVSRQIDAWEQSLVSMNANLKDGPRVARNWMYFDPDDAISIRVCEENLVDGHIVYTPVGGQLNSLDGQTGSGGKVNRSDVVEVKVSIHVDIPMIFYFGWEGDTSLLPLKISGVEEYKMYVSTSRYRSASVM